MDADASVAKRDGILGTIDQWSHALDERFLVECVVVATLDLAEPLRVNGVGENDSGAFSILCENRRNQLLH